MARYERDFMGRVRRIWDRFSEGLQHDRGGPMRRGRMDAGPRRPMEATGPGGEGYFLSADMARDARYSMDYDVGYRGVPSGGMAQFGRAGAGRGYGGDYRTGRGGSDAGEFFVNRSRGGDTGYPGGYERDLGMRGGMASGGRSYGADYGRGNLAGGGRGYGADYGRGGYAMGYDRGFRGGHLDRGRGYSGDYRHLGSGMRSDYSGTYREGGVMGQSSARGRMVPPAGREHEGSDHSRTPPPYTRGR